jgi:hypothetical protein
MTDIPHETVQSTANSLTHFGIILLLVAILFGAAIVGTFIEKVDVLTVLLINMRQECLMEAR